MEKSNGTVKNNLQIIKYPNYQPYTKPLLAWFDIRVFYVRISNFMINGYTPEYLTLNHIPLDPDTVLEVNGQRCTLDSVPSCRLRRNRVDKKFEEATFVSTDSIRLSGSVKFEVFDGEDLMLSGVLEMIKNNNGFTGESKINNDVGKWNMKCESMISGGSRFLKGKQIVGCDSMPPMIEVYVAGSFSGVPVILTKTLQISLKKKQSRKGVLDTIPECDLMEPQKDVSSEFDLQSMHKAEYGSYKTEYDYDYDERLYLEGENGELTWFNAGVRVGVGLGLGICLGVGIGVGLLVRTYQSTTRNFRRRLL